MSKLPITIKPVVSNSGFARMFEDQDGNHLFVFAGTQEVTDAGMAEALAQAYNRVPRWHKIGSSWKLYIDGQEKAVIRELEGDRDFKFKLIIGSESNDEGIVIFRTTLEKAQDTGLYMIDPCNNL